MQEKTTGLAAETATGTASRIKVDEHPAAWTEWVCDIPHSVSVLLHREGCHITVTTYTLYIHVFVLQDS